MSTPIATAFQSLRTSLVQETRSATLGLYRLLLRSSEQYTSSNILKSAIREKFQINKHNNSRRNVLDLLNQAEKIQLRLEKGDPYIKDKVNLYTKQYEKSMKAQCIAQQLEDKSSSKKKPIKARKPYQVAIDTFHSSGLQFKRVRGWKQPVRTAMMIKNKVKSNQLRLDKYHRLLSELDMIKSERMFLDNLGCLPKDRLIGYEKNIHLALDKVNEIHRQLKSKTKENNDIASN